MKKFMRLDQLIWMVITHWFVDWSDNEPEVAKPRFTMCDGCRADWREWWHPSEWPEEVKP